MEKLKQISGEVPYDNILPSAFQIGDTVTLTFDETISAKVKGVSFKKSKVRYDLELLMHPNFGMKKARTRIYNVDSAFVTSTLEKPIQEKSKDDYVARVFELEESFEKIGSIMELYLGEKGNPDFADIYEICKSVTNDRLES